MNQKRAENEEIFNDDDERAAAKGGKGDELFNEMRETRTGFGAKMAKGGGKGDYQPGKHHEAEGGLQPDEDDDEDGEGVDDDEDEDDGEEGVDVDDDEEDEGSDHNF